MRRGSPHGGLVRERRHRALRGTCYSDTLEQVLYYAALRFLTWFIIVKDFIPISLYVSLELVQFLQALFMQWDARCEVSINGAAE